jgi:hypothetical protein
MRYEHAARDNLAGLFLGYRRFSVAVGTRSITLALVIPKSSTTVCRLTARKRQRQSPPRNRGLKSSSDTKSAGGVERSGADTDSAVGSTPAKAIARGKIVYIAPTRNLRRLMVGTAMAC